MEEDTTSHGEAIAGRDQPPARHRRTRPQMDTSVPLCQWRGLKWIFTNTTPLLCNGLSSPQWTNLSLSKDSSLHLLSLQLPSAGLAGTLPSELGELSTPQSLYLGVNKLSGTIPLELGYSSSLSDIDLGYNFLNGSLRTSFWNLSLMTGTVVLASLLIGYVQGKKRKNRDEDEEEEELEEGEDDENHGGSGGGEGKLVLFEGGEHLTLEEVLNATGQVMEKTSYGTIYKAKLADGGTIALSLLREGSCRDGSSCLPVIKQLGRVRHENLIPLRAFYQGKRGEKLLIYDYLPNRTLHDLLQVLEGVKQGSGVSWWRESITGLVSISCPIYII